MNFNIFVSESGWSELAFSKHKGKENSQIVLFFARLLPRQVLSSANLAHPRRPPQRQLHNQTPLTWGISHAQTCRWEEGCLYCIYILLLCIPACMLLRATCPPPAAPQCPALPSHPFCEEPNVTFLLCPVLLSSHPPAEQLLLEQM